MNEAFVSWFKNSEAVHLDGKPLIVFHVTGQDFDIFATDPRDIGGEIIDTIGAWFAGNPILANDVYNFYLKRREGQPRTIPCYISIQKPLNVRSREDLVDTIIATIFVSLSKEQKQDFKLNHLTSSDSEEVLKSVKFMKNKLMQLGYDGIHIHRDTDIGDSWVVFSAMQVKLAIGNNGAYGTDNPKYAESTEPLFGFLTESKAFRNEQDGQKFTTKELGEICFAMMLSLHLLGQTDLKEDVKSYCSTTLRYPKFDRVYLSGSDLGNVIALLRNAKELLDQRNVDVPVLDLKQYLHNFRTDKMLPKLKRSFFYRLQAKLKINDGQLLSLARDIADPDGLNTTEINVLGSKLYAQLRRFEYKCDILALLQKLMDGIES